MYWKRSNPCCNGNECLTPLNTPQVWFHMGNVSGNAIRVEIRNASKTFCTKVSVNIWKSPSTQCRRDKVALRTTCNRNVKIKIIKIRTGCQHVKGTSTAAKTWNGPCKTFDWAGSGQRAAIGQSCFRMWMLYLIESRIFIQKLSSWRHTFCDATLTVRIF